MDSKDRAKTHHEVRGRVASAYGDAIAAADRPARADAGDALPAWQASEVGYAAGELDGLPEGVDTTSFGCGNPLAFAEVRRGDTVLDLGSGAGLDLLIAGHKTGPSGRVIGVDMTGAMIARARDNIAVAGMDHVEVREGIIEDLPVASTSVDWVISNCVLSLSSEKDRAFGEIARVLKPGGRMLISDVVTAELPDWALADAVLYDACISGALSEAAFLAGLRRAGLEDIAVRGRMVYGAAEIDAFVDPAAPPSGGASLGERLAGKVWSASFHARKPRGIRDRDERRTAT
ncbi:MAG: methyltransferase domain-containing protein [Alphaproteobacteria bacterium]